MFWIGLLLGVYLLGFALTFCVTMFFCILGGRESDLWKPFFFSPTWPLSIWFFR